MSGYTSMKHTEKLGILLIFLFNILSGLQAVYLSGMLQNADVFSTLILTFSLVSLYFYSVQLASKKVLVETQWKDWIAVNLTTAGSWLGFFVALKYIEPAISSALANSIGPLVTIVITVFILRKEKLSTPQLITALGVMASMIFMINSTFTGNSAIGYITHEDAMLGVVMSFLCGISMALNTLASKSLNQKGITPGQIMSKRFVLLILIAFILCDKLVLAYTLTTFHWEILMIAVIGNIIPLYCLQLGIKKSDTLIVSFTLVTAPIIYLFIQMFNSRLTFSMESLIGTSSAIVFVIIGIYLKQRRNTQELTQEKEPLRSAS